MAQEAKQGVLNFGETFKVGCRVDGTIQQYVIDNCYSIREARQAVEDGVPGARPILAVIKGGKVDKPLDQGFSYTRSPGPSAA